MPDSKFTDAVLARFAGKAPPSVASVEDDEDDEPAGNARDIEDGRMLAAAIKRGDGAAICEAVRRITGG